MTTTESQSRVTIKTDNTQALYNALAEIAHLEAQVKLLREALVRIVSHDDLSAQAIMAREALAQTKQPQKSPPTGEY